MVNCGERPEEWNQFESIDSILSRSIKIGFECTTPCPQCKGKCSEVHKDDKRFLRCRTCLYEWQERLTNA